MTRRLIALIVAALLLAGAASCALSDGRWYRGDANQLDFDRDSSECDLLAGKAATDASLLGKRPNLELYAKAFNDCILAKGWSRTPTVGAAQRQDQGRPEPLAGLEGPDTVRVFGKTITLPPGFALQTRSVQSQGFARGESMVWLGPDGTVVTLGFQMSLAQDFEQADFPVARPFFVYDRGEGKQGRGKDRWAVYYGQVEGTWVAAMGVFLLAGDTERAIVVVTRPLPPPEASPPSERLRLSIEQKKILELFEVEWQEWRNHIDEAWF